MYAHHLQAPGMATDTVDRNAGCYLRISLMKPDMPGVHAPHHAGHVLYVERLREHLMAHIAPGGIGDLTVLKVDSGGREEIKISNVIIMHVRYDDVVSRRNRPGRTSLA